MMAPPIITPTSTTELISSTSVDRSPAAFTFGELGAVVLYAMYVGERVGGIMRQVDDAVYGRVW